MVPAAPSSAAKNREHLRVLLIDDDEELCQLTADYLSPLGFHVEVAGTGAAGAERATSELWHAVILDVMLPDVDGFEVLRRIRAKSKVPVLMLTGRGEEVDRVVGLELGADDYLPKTFSSRELLARLRAAVRRAGWVEENPAQSPVREVIAGPLRISSDTHTATLEDKALTLTRTEFDLLLVLARAKGRVKSRDQLFDELRGSEWDVFDRAIDMHISSLRKKLGDDPKEPRFIRTVRGVGYMLTVPEDEAMRLRFPLYGKVLFWFFVNLALVAALAYGFMRMQFRVGMEWLLAGSATQRLEAMSQVITADLRERPSSRWGEVLEHNRAAHGGGVTFAIFRNDARQVAGPEIQPPTELEEKLRDRRGPPNPRAQQPRPDGAQPGPPPARLSFFLRAGEPAKYWAGIHIGVTHDGPGDPRPVTLLLVADSIRGGGLFFDPLPWLALVAAALLISGLVWLPIVSGITRAVRRVNTAARSIAEGRFDVRVPEERRDELGELGGSVNAMAAQLGKLVDHQRRLTADVAHELCSPIARMQRALGVVEQRAVPEQAAYIEKLDRELQHMARLVEEVMSFTKAAALPALAEPEEFPLAELAGGVIAREAADAKIELHIPPELRIRTIRESLDRALSNVLRNAVRYAAHAGPIEVRAQSVSDATEIIVRDHGPGVPADALEKIFEPFYRPEAARQRTTGGAGLGLAIVKRCVEACGGSVSAMLATPTGLSVCLRLSHSGTHPGGSKAFANGESVS